MNEQLKWVKSTFFTGRNGFFKCNGIDVQDLETDVMIAPLTSKGNIGRCDIAVPKEKIPELIEILKNFI